MPEPHDSETLSDAKRSASCARGIRTAPPLPDRNPNFASFVMQCPECSGRRLTINVMLTGSITCNFASDPPGEILNASEFDSEWDHSAQCACSDCSWRGVVAEAAEAADELSPANTLGEEVARIEQELKADQCPQPLAESVRKLIHAVRSLQAQVRTVQNTATSTDAPDGNPSRR